MSFLSSFTPYSFPLLGLVRLPEIKVEVADKARFRLKPGASNASYLKALIWDGYKRKLASGKFTGFSESQVKERLKMEFEVFEKTGTIDYFLLLWDISEWCDKQGILRGKGRGSSAGSLAMYFLGITDINSLEYNLFFSRFLSEARLKPKVIDGVTYVDGKMAPDVDSDFQYLRRPEVIQYIEQRYPGRVSKISTRLQLTGKTALKDVLKVYGEYDETTAKHISDYVESQFGNVESLSKAQERHKDFREWIDNRTENRVMFDIARAIEGLNITRGQHPSGVFISYAPLDGNIPVEMVKGEDVVTSYDMNVSATLGIKADILGIRTLDVVGETCQQIAVTPESIDVHHQSIYEYFDKCDHYLGLFQIESGLTKEVVKRVKPRNMDELAACVAISRPGALKYIDQFVEYVRKGVVKPIYSALDEILRPTGGIILYQETITEVCQKLFGMTAIEADTVRYNVGKKLKDEMKKTEPVLYEKGRANGVPDKIIKYFWDVCNSSADYLFVKSHAYSYANLTAATAYLKANHPREFILALLKLSRHEPDSQAVLNAIITESKQMGIAILPPDITKSQADFSIEPDGVRFGLSHIRGISDSTMSKLLSFKRDFSDPFSIFDAAQEAKLSISVVVGLIYSGCISFPGMTRTKLAVQAQMYNLLTDREKLIVARLAPEYKYDLVALFAALAGREAKDGVDAIAPKTDEKGKPYIKASRIATFRRDLKPYWAMYQANSRHEELTSFLLERYYLGFSYSNSLFNLYARKVEGLVPVAEVLMLPKNSEVTFVAFVNEFKKAIGRESKKEYVRFHLSDESGAIKAMISGSDKIARCIEANGELPGEDSIVVVHGSKGDGDLVFANSIVLQPNPIRLKKEKEKTA
jgi:DNA-directed DNA polymerase III PolC